MSDISPAPVGGEVGNATLVVAADKITVKTTHMPTAMQLAKFAQNAQDRGWGVDIESSNDGWAFLCIPATPQTVPQ
ncbi:MAG: hypothetical protein ACYS7Y_33960 [Planctomycetota bacterium]|jgi:hypothetical protein